MTTAVALDRAPTAARTDEPRSAESSRPRDALLDNAKYVLILLVFVGHAIEPGAKTRLGDVVYYWIYLFHMPAFVLICGYLARSYDGSPRRVGKLVTTLLVPYLIFWAIYGLQSLSTGRNRRTDRWTRCGSRGSWRRCSCGGSRCRCGSGCAGRSGSRSRSRSPRGWSPPGTRSGCPGS